MVNRDTTGRRALRLVPLLLLLLVFAAGPAARAYRWFWQNTHQRITTEALLQTSNLTPFLAQMGLEDVRLSGDYARLAGHAPGVSIGNPAAPAGAILAGAVLEDGVKNDAGSPLAGTFDWKRPKNHFENKLGQPLTAAIPGPNLPLLNHAASKWGGDVAANEFNWKVAQERYAEAVTAKTEEERTEALEVALVALGCNLHLLQDMFQPAHTRNDSHPGHELFLGELTAGHSELEHYAGAGFTPSSGALPWSVSSPKRLPDRDQYFRSAVIYSYDNFFSDDTEFVEPLPKLGTDVYKDVSSVPCPTTPEDVTYARSHTQQTPVGADAHLARRKSWCLHAGLPGENHQCWDLKDAPCAGTERVLDDHMAILIPRAISYSAGLIDHFFRGRMAFAQGTDGSLTIENQSHEITEPGLAIDVDFRQDPIEVPAELVFLWEDEAGDRTEFHREKLPSGGIPFGESFTIPGFATLLPAAALASGATKVAVLLERAHVGDDPSVVGGVFGWTTCSQICRKGAAKLTAVGDLTDDDADDLAIWMLSDETAGDPAVTSVALLSGTDCDEVWKLAGGPPSELYGARVVGVGDVSGDGVGDLVVQKKADVQSSIFTMELRSGASSGLIQTFAVQELGELHALGDVGGDGVEDFLIRGATASVYRGTGAFLHTLFGIATNETVTLAPDYDGDGGADLLVKSNTGGQYRVVSTQSGAVLTQQSFAGKKEVVAIDDVNGDGVRDFAANVGSTQTLLVQSGKDGSTLWSVDGVAALIGSAGDFDGDGFLDISAHSFVVEGDPPAIVFTIRIFSPKKKKKLLTIDPQGDIPGLPVPVGDLNADGRGDVAYAYADSSGINSCFEIVMGVSP